MKPGVSPLHVGFQGSKAAQKVGLPLLQQAMAILIDGLPGSRVATRPV